MYVLRLPLKGATRIREVRGIPAGPVNGGAGIAIDEYGLQFEGILAQDVASGEPVIVKPGERLIVRGRALRPYCGWHAGPIESPGNPGSMRYCDRPASGSLGYCRAHASSLRALYEICVAGHLPGACSAVDSALGDRAEYSVYILARDDGHLKAGMTRSFRLLERISEQEHLAAAVVAVTRSLRDAREMEESISGSLGAGGSGAPGPSGGDRFSAAALIEAAAADMGLRAGRPFYILSGEPPPPGDLRAGAIARRRLLAGLPHLRGQGPGALRQGIRAHALARILYTFLLPMLISIGAWVIAAVRGYLYVVLASTSFFLSYYSRLAWSVLSTYSSLRPTPYDDGLIFSLFFAAYIIVQVPSGLVSDAIGPKAVLTAALLGLAASSVLSGLAGSMVVEYIGSILMGFSAGWIYPTTVKLLSGSFEGGGLARAMGYYSLAWPLSVVLLGVGLPAVAEDLGWRWGYYLIGVASAAVAVAVIALMKDVGRRGNGSLSLRVLATRKVALLSIGGFLFYYAYWTFAFYAYDYLRSIGMSGVLAGEIYSMTAVAGIASTVLAGYLIARVGLWRAFLLSIPLYGLTILGFAFLRAPIWLAFMALAMGFFRFMITPSNSTLASVLGGPDRSGSVTGAANFFWQLSGVIAGAAAPLIFVPLGYGSLWVSMAAMVFASLIPYAMLRGAMSMLSSYRKDTR